MSVDLDLTDEDIRYVYQAITDAENWGKDNIENWSDPIYHGERLQNAQIIFGRLSIFTPMFDSLLRDTNELLPSEFYKLDGIWVFKKLYIINEMGMRFFKTK